MHEFALSTRLSPEKEAVLLERMRALAGVDTATPQQHPVAVWVLGASGAGKTSTVESEALAKFLQSADVADAANVDGSLFRKVHEGWLSTVADGRSRNCVWKSAWGNENFRTMNFEAKGHVLAAAAGRRVNMFISDTCIDILRCLKNLEMLRAHGYVNHAVIVGAPLGELVDRGGDREMKSGKVYMPDVRRAVGILPRFLQHLDGKFAIVDNGGRSPRLVETGRGGGESLESGSLADAWGSVRSCFGLATIGLLAMQLARTVPKYLAKRRVSAAHKTMEKITWPRLENI
jgi:hypothetical protein